MLAIVIVPALSGAAKNRKAPQSGGVGSIEVIGHLALPAGPVVNLVASPNGRRDYLYVEHGSPAAVTTIDVTDPHIPKAVAELTPLPGDAPQHVSEVEGPAVLLTGTTTAPRAPAPDTVTIVSYEDPAHPKVVRQFSHVACMLKNVARGVIYLVNDEGLWVLQTRPAPDRELLEEYDRYLRYNH